MYLTKHTPDVVSTAVACEKAAGAPVTSCLLSSAPPPGAAERTVLAASEVWVDVVVGQRSVPIPKQALYAAASDLRLATEAHVGWEDCASVVVTVLTAMESKGVLRFV